MYLFGRLRNITVVRLPTLSGHICSPLISEALEAVARDCGLVSPATVVAAAVGLDTEGFSGRAVMEDSCAAISAVDEALPKMGAWTRTLR